MDKKNLEILTNIIGAVESGGQIYGNRRYEAYAGAYTNSNFEKTCTLGWAQNYGNEGRELCRMILERDPVAFRRADNAGIEQKLNTDWVATAWNPSTRQKQSLIAIITTDTGKKCQDELFEELMTKYEASAIAFGVQSTNIPAIMMWCEIEHLGGLGPVKRIFTRAKKPYTPDSIYASLILDQNDTSNSNQVGDQKFQTRHQCCVKWIKQYVTSEKKDDEKMETKNVSEYEKLLSVLESEVGYLEKASNSNLDSKSGNAGSSNYTKYWRDIKSWGLGDYQAQYWCAAFVYWCFVKALGFSRAKELLLHAPFIYCPTLGNLSKSKGQLYSSPKVGDVVLFNYNGTFGHTGVVYAVKDGYFYTIEGNTSGASGVIANGGGVVKGKRYPVSGTGHRFHRPKYKGVAAENATVETKTVESPLSKVPRFVGMVTADELNVRTWAGTSYPNIKSYPILKKGNLIDVCDSLRDSNGNSWFYVRIANKYYGFVASQYIKRQ